MARDLEMTEAEMDERLARVDRRQVVVAASAFLIIPVFAQMAAADGASALYLAARSDLLQGRPVRTGLVKVEAPRLAENGNSVLLKVSVASPMTPKDFVRTIHILSEKNPIATIARLQLGLRAGRAEVSTNIRLATTQTIHAFAEMSDGTLAEGSAEIVVTLAACLDGT